MKVIAGIDPGQEGAVVVLADGYPVLAQPLPTAPKLGLDALTFSARMRDMKSHWPDVSVILEQAQSMPKQGIASAFKYGRDYGVIIGVLASLSIPYVLVSPGVWHRQVCGAKDGEAKALALRTAQQRFPMLQLIPTGRRVPHEGIVDAVLIALWGAEKTGGVLRETSLPPVPPPPPPRGR